MNPDELKTLWKLSAEQLLQIRRYSEENIPRFAGNSIHSPHSTIFRLLSHIEALEAERRLDCKPEPPRSDGGDKPNLTHPDAPPIVRG